MKSQMLWKLFGMTEKAAGSESEFALNSASRLERLPGASALWTIWSYGIGLNIARVDCNIQWVQVTDADDSTGRAMVVHKVGTRDGECCVHS